MPRFGWDVRSAVRLVLALAVVAILVGGLELFYVRYRIDRGQQLMGLTESAVVEKWGMPSKTRTDDRGEKYLTYEKYRESRFGHNVHYTVVHLNAKGVVDSVL